MGGYAILISNANIDVDKHGCYVVGVGLEWSSNLAKIPTLEGSKSVPDIPKGSIAVQLLVPPSGTAQGAASATMYTLSACQDVDLNGIMYANCFHTGGGLAVQDFGEGLQAMVLIKRYSVFGQLTTGA